MIEGIHVAPCATLKNVFADPAGHDILAQPAIDRVLARTGTDDIVTLSTVHEIGIASRIQPIVLAKSIELIVGHTATKPIVLVRTELGSDHTLVGLG